MFARLLPGSSKRAPTWPRARIEENLRRTFNSLIVIGQDDSHTIYDVADRAFRFVVALVHDGGAKAGVTEIGFLARFVGFKLNDAVLRRLNGDLHLSAAFIEEGDLYILAKVAAKGPFADNRFTLVLSAWTRDMTFALDALGREPVAAASEAPAGAAFDARQIGARPSAFHSAFFWRNEPMSFCPACKGRGRRGAFARACAPCDGAGFLDPTA